MSRGAMEECPGSSKYLRPVSKEDRLLGKGGYSITVERCSSTSLFGLLAGLMRQA